MGALQQAMMAASTSGGNEVPDLIADVWDWWEPSRETGLVNNDPIGTLHGRKNGRNFSGTVGSDVQYDTDNALNGLAVGDITSNKLILGPDMSAITTAAHVFYVFMVPIQAGSNGIWELGSNSPGPPVVAFSDDHIYESAFRTNNRVDMGTPVQGLANLWNIYEVESATNSWKVYINGIQQGSTQNPNTVGGLATPRIGPGTGLSGNGYFAGLYICDAVLSSGDRTSLIDYIVDRFGLGGSENFIITPTLSSLRSDFTGQVGLRFTTVGAVEVTHLGRWRVSGNSQTHTLRIVRVSDNVVVASASYDASAGTVAAFNYVALGSPVTLAAGTQYYLTSAETNGGDQWYTEMSISVRGVGKVTNSIFSADGISWTTGSGANKSYVPIDMKFTRSFT